MVLLLVRLTILAERWNSPFPELLALIILQQHVTPELSHVLARRKIQGFPTDRKIKYPFFQLIIYQQRKRFMKDMFNLITILLEEIYIFTLKTFINNPVVQNL